MGNKYSKASVTGFFLIMLSVLIGQFFIFNDAMFHVLGRDFFYALFNPLLVCLFLTQIAGFVLSVIGLIKSIRKKLKGKGFSIAAIVISLVELTVIVLCFGILLLTAMGEGSSHKPDNIVVTTTETTVKETKEPEFYENNEHLIFLKNNINDEMSLSEIIDVFEKMSREPADNQDRIVFEAGSNYCTVYDYSAGEYVDVGYHYYFCLKRWFTAEDGEVYQVCVNVMYKPDSNDYKYTDDSMSIDVYGNVNEDFFDDIRNSQAYQYASSLELERVDVFMGPRQ